MQRIESMLAAGDWDAVERVRGGGEPAVARLRPFLSHEDDVVRLLAVDSIAAAGGPAAIGPLLAALRDDNEKVAVNAAYGLRGLPLQGRGPALLLAYDAAWNPFVRAQIALLLGLAGGPEVMEGLPRRITIASAAPREALQAAAARLGDIDARRAIADLLRDARGERIRELLDLVAYIGQSWLLRPLRPLLDRDEVAHNLSTHRTRVVRRGKDLAVDAVLAIGRPPVAFQKALHYDDEQVRQIALYLDSLPDELVDPRRPR